MAVNVDMVKCACADCVCIVGVGAGVESEGRQFCGENCANHHESSEGCDHAGCPCHG